MVTCINPCKSLIVTGSLLFGLCFIVVPPGILLFSYYHHTNLHLFQYLKKYIQNILQMQAAQIGLWIDFTTAIWLEFFFTFVMAEGGCYQT